MMRPDHVRKINKATNAMHNQVAIAVKDPFRPQYHFLPPASWMNDPNGTIFYRGEYHLFYQHNPYQPAWGKMQWGHAKSTDLVHWDHLPIALVPDGFPGEVQCWSGCCVIAPDGTPTIFYTSMNAPALLTHAERFSQQWIATSDTGMLAWKKSARNSILHDRKSHPAGFIPRQWRDPYIFRECDDWYMVLGGREPAEAYGCVFLYRSQDLYNWEYRGILSTYRVAPRKSIECANYFPLDGKYVLLVSPYTQVSFSIGDFVNDQHSAQDWYVFDHSLQYYATNTYQDDQNRTIVVGWIRANGSSGWAGCLSLPRVVRLDMDNCLRIEPIKELEVLRTAHRHAEYVLDLISEQKMGDAFVGNCVEIQAQYDLQNAGVVGFKLIDDQQTHLISYDVHKNIFQAVNEIAALQFPQEQRLSLRIFIDRSVVEIFINDRETFSTTIYPELADDHQLKIVPFVENVNGHASLDFWNMRSINLDRLGAA